MNSLVTLPLLAQSGGTFWLPQSGSTLAPYVDWVFYFIFYVSLFAFAIIVFLMTLFVVVYRRRPGLEQKPAPSHNTPLEVFWSAVPTVALVLMFYWGFVAYLDMRVPPANSYQVEVTGQQWKWLFKYPNGLVTDVLHVPVDQPVRLLMRSNDVIHSFYVPAFRIKMDLVPGRYTTTWFQSTTPGTYEVLCAEYCGDSHSDMVAHLVVHESGGFEKWLAEAGNYLKSLPPIEAGRAVYLGKGGCAQCHSIDGAARVGPTFKGLWGETQRFRDGGSSVVDENYVRESILQPGKHVVEGYQNQMPSFTGVLTDDEIGYLTKFIESLK